MDARSIRKMTSDEIAEFQKEKERLQTPLPGNKCRNCGGGVARMPCGKTKKGYSLKAPACKTCGRVHLNALDAPIEGVKEFEEIQKKIDQETKYKPF